MAFSTKHRRFGITLTTANSEDLTAMFLPVDLKPKRTILFKVFPNENFYFDTEYSMETSHHTDWIQVDKETFIKATALRALGGYAYVHELFKDQL